MTTTVSGSYPAVNSDSDVTINGLTVGKGGGASDTNTVVGAANALAANTSGTYNNAFGRGALQANTSGAYNSAFGWTALLNSTTGSYNTAIGNAALTSNTTASNNTAVGYQAGYTGTTGTGSVYLGQGAGYSATSSYNTVVGREAGYNVSSGGYNTFLGQSAGYYVTTGAKNTIIGQYNGNQGGLDIRTSSNRIVLSDGDGNPRAYHNNSAWYWCATDMSSTYRLEFDGAEFYPGVDNGIKCGYPSNRWTVVYAISGTINTSDANQKQQIRSLNDVEKAVATRIKGLIKAFKFNDSVVEKGDGARIHIGVIAQEVKAAFEAENLNPSKYALFCSDTWYEVNGMAKDEEGHFYTKESEGSIEITRLGIRYDQLLAFVISTL
jgi:hypothetical protein